MVKSHAILYGPVGLVQTQNPCVWKAPFNCLRRTIRLFYPTVSYVRLGMRFSRRFPLFMLAAAKTSVCPTARLRGLLLQLIDAWQIVGLEWFPGIEPLLELVHIRVQNVM